MKGKTTQIAVLTDGKTIKRWEERVLAKIATIANVSVDLVIINDGEISVTDSSLRELISNKFGLDPWKFYISFQSLMRKFTKRSKYGGLKDPINIGDVPCLNSAEKLYCEPVPAGSIGNKLPKKAVKELKKTDLAIRFGFGILKGRALSAPTHGVLSFHHGDLREYRGRPAGFWEYLNGDSTAGVTLQRLSETLDGGEIIEFKEVEIMDAKSWPEVQHRLLKTSDMMVTQALEDINNLNFSPQQPESLSKLYTNPGWQSLFKYFLKQLKPG